MSRSFRHVLISDVAVVSAVLFGLLLFYAFSGMVQDIIGAMLGFSMPVEEKVRAYGTHSFFSWESHSITLYFKLHSCSNGAY